MAGYNAEFALVIFHMVGSSLNSGIPKQYPKIFQGIRESHRAVKKIGVVSAL